MLIKYYGHSFFSFLMNDGTIAVTDPYGEFYAYPKRQVAADYCLISHHHYDHDAVESVSADAQIIDTQGEHILGFEKRVLSIPTWHDEAQGAKRGPNLIHILEADGLRIAHCGDLGHRLTKSQADAMGRIDLLLLPVGGYYTIDEKAAADVIGMLQPKVTIPMHYRTLYDEEMSIASLPVFLREVKMPDTQLPLLRVTAGDIGERPPVLTLAITE